MSVLDSGPSVGIQPILHFRRERKTDSATYFLFLCSVWGDTLSFKAAGTVKTLPHISHASRARPFPPTPKCVVPHMNLNLVPQQLPSIILAATANCPCLPFFPIKKSLFSSLLWWNCLARLLRKWISQQACGPGVFHRWKVRLDVRVPVGYRTCIFVCDLKVCNGLFKPIYLQESFFGTERSVTPKPHVLQASLSVTNFQERAISPRRKRISEYLTEIHYSHFASKINVLMPKQACLNSPLFSACQKLTWCVFQRTACYTQTCLKLSGC